jgi:hypothetical protein
MYPKLKKPRVGKQGVVSPIELAYLLLFTALAIILHIFQFPFPLATFLAYDLSGIPIAMLTLINVRLGVSSLPIFWLGLVYLTRGSNKSCRAFNEGCSRSLYSNTSGSGVQEVFKNS